jgi:hypothetical protein
LHLPLVILGEAPVPTEPPESPLHDPPLRQDLENLGLLVALDDFELPPSLLPTCVTLLFGRNVNPKIVSEMLDHTTTAITLDTYGHVLPHTQNEVTKALEDVLS